MAFDYKKEYRTLYLPSAAPQIVEVPELQYAAVRGRGDPNQPEGAYQQAVKLLYSLSYTIKMSDRSAHRIAGYFPYVVPPLEGLWQQDGTESFDPAHKERFEWTAMLRLPEFVTRADFDWALRETARKKHLDVSGAELFLYREGLCVQCMHTGPYDDEPAAIRRMETFARENGCVPDLSAARPHHEIYLSDPRRTAPEKRRTVLRHPVKLMK